MARRKASTVPAHSAPAPAAPTKRRLAVGLDTAMHSRMKLAGLSGTDIFKIAEHPPRVVPAGIAMDDANGSLAWAANQIGTMVSEGLTFMGYPILAEMSQRPEYRRMVETIARNMTRKWIKIKTTGEDDKSAMINVIEKELKRLKAQHVFQAVAEQDGFFGRGHIYLDFGDDDDPIELATPVGNGRNSISRSKVNKERPLKRIRAIEAMWCYPSSYNSSNPLRPDWYKPQSWFVMGKELHHSRLLTLVSREVPDLLKPTYSFGGLPLTQMAKPYVDNWLRTRQSVADIIHSFSVFVLKTNLVEQLGETDDGGERLWNRLAMFNNVRDNRGILALDKEIEEFANISAPLGTLDALQSQTQEHMSAVSGIPLVELLGVTPSGLNASSEGEIKTFHEWIHSNQERLFREPLERLIGFIQLSKWGIVDESIIFDFEPLGQMDESELASIRKTEADTDVVYVEAGILSVEEIRKRISEDEDSPYEGIDPEEAPVPPAEAGMGEDPFGGMPGAPAPEGGEDPSAGPPGQPDEQREKLMPKPPKVKMPEADVNSGNKPAAAVKPVAKPAAIKDPAKPTKAV